MKEALYAASLFHEFAGLCRNSRSADESTILRFRHLLKLYKLADQLMTLVNDFLTGKGLLLKAGTAIDATLIAAPNSTKNQNGRS